MLAPMIMLDALIRFSAFGLLLGLALTVFQLHRASTTGRLLLALCFSLMALMISTAPAGLGVPAPLLAFARFVDVPNTVLAWLFVKSLMSDDFVLDWRHLGVLVIFCVAVWFMWLNIYFSWGLVQRWHSVLLNLFALSLFVQLLYEIVHERRDDLVESRRRLRLYFVLAVIVLVALAIASEIFLRHLDRQVLSSFKVAITLVLVIAGHLWFLTVRTGHIAFSTPGWGDERPSMASDLTERERQLKTTLDHTMDVAEVWRDPKLTIKGLAVQLGITEHKLRAFINQRLGHRNFRRYLLGYRLASVKRDLADPAQRDMPILTVALSNGFQSIATFNRVFRDSEQEAPNTYRERLLSLVSD